MQVLIREIHIPERIRNDLGNSDELAQSIKTLGLINPITLMESVEGYVLIAGYRRLIATIQLGATNIAATVVSPKDAEDQLLIEINENENRKDFTVSERVTYAEKLMAIEQEKARKRMSEASKLKSTPVNTDTSRSRDNVARMVGFRSGRQLDRALYIARNSPNLMDQVNSGQKSITGAYEEARGISRKRTSKEFTPNPDQADYAFVLEKVEIAAWIFTDAVKAASEHYKHINQTEIRSEMILKTIEQAGHLAQTIFKASMSAQQNQSSSEVSTWLQQ